MSIVLFWRRRQKRKSWGHCMSNATVCLVAETSRESEHQLGGKPASHPNVCALDGWKLPSGCWARKLYLKRPRFDWTTAIIVITKIVAKVNEWRIANAQLAKRKILRLISDAWFNNWTIMSKLKHEPILTRPFHHQRHRQKRGCRAPQQVPRSRHNRTYNEEFERQLVEIDICTSPRLFIVTKNYRLNRNCSRAFVVT